MLPPDVAVPDEKARASSVALALMAFRSAWMSPVLPLALDGGAAGGLDGELAGWREPGKLDVGRAELDTAAAA